MGIKVGQKKIVYLAGGNFAEHQQQLSVRGPLASFQKPVLFVHLIVEEDLPLLIPPLSRQNDYPELTVEF